MRDEFEDEDYINNLTAFSSREEDEITKAFIACALWSSIDYETDEPMDSNYIVSDIDKHGLKKAAACVSDFLQKAVLLGRESIPRGYGVDQIGHDLWLSINGHGAGFFDGHWDKGVMPLGDYLQDIARDMREMSCEPIDANTFTIE